MSDIINMDALGEHIDETVTGYLDENLEDIVKDSGEIEDGVERYMERNAEDLLDEYMGKVDVALMVKEYLDGSPELIDVGIKDKVATIFAEEIKSLQERHDKTILRLDEFKQGVAKYCDSYRSRIDKLEADLSNRPNSLTIFLQVYVSVMLTLSVVIAYFAYWS